MSIKLKIKANTLAAEARIIRKNEKRLRKFNQLHMAQKRNYHWADSARESLYRHRIDVVRPEARATHLARAYLKGSAYRSVEQSTRQPVADALIDKINAMVRKYGPGDCGPEDIQKWIEVA